ncbi:MAG: hypothetical protein GY810_11740 [Aureispira sp.]|nr:hypothetical protein [Aureispira sp.]
MRLLKLWILVLIPLLGTSIVNGQGWMKSIGDIYDFPYSLEVLENGGYLVVCEAQISTAPNGRIIRTDDNGTVLWRKDYIFPNIGGVAEMNNNNFLIVHDLDQNQDSIGVSEIDVNGNLLWTKKLESGLNGMGPNGAEIVQTFDQKFVVKTQSGFIHKIDSIGDPLWSYRVDTIDINPVDWQYDFLTHQVITKGVQEMSDESLIIVGTDALNQNTSRIALVQLDKNGNLLFKKEYPINNPSFKEVARCFILTQDGGVLIGGEVDTTGIFIKNMFKN